MIHGDRASSGGVARRIAELADAITRRRGGCLVVDQHGATVAPELPDDVRAIVVRASPDEQLLAYAGLAEICDPLLPLFPELPPVQRRALEGALAMGPPEGDALAVAAGLRSLLHLAAEREPILLVVEEAHLLDRGTAAVLAYAIRRVDQVPLGIVLSQDANHPGRLELPVAERITVDHRMGPSQADLGAPSPMDAVDRAEARGSVADVAAALEAVAAGLRGQDRTDALIDAGQAWLDAGQLDRARVAAHQADAASGRGGRSARAELLLGRIEMVLGNGQRSSAHLRAAAEAAGPDRPEVAACALLLLVAPAIFAGRVDEAVGALRSAREHLELAEVTKEHPLRRMLVAAEAAVALATGRSTDTRPILELAAGAGEHPGSDAEVSLLVTLGALPLVWVERFDVALPLLRNVVAALRARGAMGALPMPLCALAVAERRAGRVTRALILAAEAKDLAAQTGSHGALLFASSELAVAHGLFGDAERCRVAADVVLRSSHRGIYRTSVLSALANLELWSGDPEAVIELLEPLVTSTDALAPSVTLLHPTLITAYIAVGRTADARPLLAELEAATPATDGRMRASLTRCQALLAPAAERDERFAEAIERAGDQVLSRALTRLFYARRLLADGCTKQAAAILHDLSQENDEDMLGVARAARLTLTRVGLAVVGGDPAWAQLDPAGLEVALAAGDDTPVLTLADRLRLSPPEVERLRDDVLAVVGVRAGPEVAAALRRSAAGARIEAPRVEVHLLGGLRVIVDGEVRALPTGAASIAMALLALRRAVHVEELTDVLWPDASPEVARRRLRNVLTRLRRAVGPIVERSGDRLELSAEVAVDHHVLETRARRALAMEPGRARMAAIEAVLAEHRGGFLPGMLYEEWTQPARHRAEAREEELTRALAAERQGR